MKGRLEVERVTTGIKLTRQGDPTFQIGQEAAEED